jgi:hypothetical protein
MRSGAAAVGGAVWLAAGVAVAHGGPAAVEVVAHHNLAPLRLAVGTSYGLASSSDGGRTWSLTCEGAIGESGSSHPRVVVTATGALVTGLFTGLVRSDLAGCNFAPGSLGEVILDMQNAPGDGHQLIALTRNADAFGVWRSEDDGATWSASLGDFGPKFQARSIGASSDPATFYVGGLTSSDGIAALAITHDGGATFTTVVVPDGATAPHDGLFVEAVDPLDPQTVVAAVYEPPSQVLLSHDGGATWAQIFEGTTVLTGLAVSPAFDELVTGSPALGLWRASLPQRGEPTAPPQKISDLAVRCLTWTPDALWVCTDEATTGFAVGRSVDRGTTVTAALELRCLTQPACEPSAQVSQVCAPEWPQLVAEVGIEQCGASEGGSTSATTGSGGHDAGGGDPNDGAPPYAVAGGCALGERAGAGWGAWLYAILFAVVRRPR